MMSKSLSKQIEICNKRGLHARASAKFVQAVSTFDAEIMVEKDGITVGGDSIMGLMMLAASPGCFIKINAKGPEAEKALTALQDLINDRFGENA